MSDLILSLQITTLGMGLVFGAIVLIWLMMLLLTRLTGEKESSPKKTSASDSPEPASVSERGFKLQAAAVAVAIALAEQAQSGAHPLEERPTPIISAWQLGMRTRQMSEKGNFRRHSS